MITAVVGVPSTISPAQQAAIDSANALKNRKLPSYLGNPDAGQPDYTAADVQAGGRLYNDNLHLGNSNDAGNFGEATNAPYGVKFTGDMNSPDAILNAHPRTAQEKEADDLAIESESGFDSGFLQGAVENVLNFFNPGGGTNADKGGGGIRALSVFGAVVGAGALAGADAGGGAVAGGASTADEAGIGASASQTASATDAGIGAGGGNVDELTDTILSDDGNTITSGTVSSSGNSLGADTVTPDTQSVATSDEVGPAPDTVPEGADTVPSSTVAQNSPGAVNSGSSFWNNAGTAVGTGATGLLGRLFGPSPTAAGVPSLQPSPSQITTPGSSSSGKSGSKSSAGGALPGGATGFLSNPSEAIPIMLAIGLIAYMLLNKRKA